MPMLARYWKWSATKEKSIGKVLKKPSAGKRVPAKKSTAVSGPRPIRLRRMNRIASAAAAEAG